ncbi:MAG: hypothetical protein BGO51_10755 [Rhodospirillales bacterium 69-11]|nr:DUF2244 domain-containing protein [Rhodospirillales bacterium]OJW29522.1 MAG: hypothetical protein BGO51_10755 [Rhodospirillales bacterium 69-11]
MPASISPDAEPTRFEALIVPHRSLSRRGTRILALAVAGFSAIIALRFWLLGAWPVALISGPEVGLALFLLHLNVRRARASELVLLQADGVRITRTSPSGRRQERRLPAAWLSVELDEAGGGVPRLLLRTRGRVEEIGAALGETEKRDLAAAFTEALHRLRNPVFDNPQLREDG